ncbi:cytochrome c oxidase subunit 2A [Melghiribacillus thermohalophilus]|nr:cytochrome c oxidase subunit 2A [Melghiribacillus thermohalophilus]
MAKQTGKTSNSAHEPNLKGTMVAVMFVAAFLIISWFGVWGIFIAR